MRKRRLSEAEYRILGGMLREAAKQEKHITILDIVRQFALTGCRRSEMIALKWTEADTEASCSRLKKVNPSAMLACLPMSGVTAHVLRHSLACIANDLGLPKVTIAAWSAR